MDIIYFDTNVLSYLADHQEIWSSLANFLSSKNMTIGISGVNILELSKATRKHRDLALLLNQFPIGMVKDPVALFQDEIKSHPNRLQYDLFKEGVTTGDLINLLSHHNVFEEREKLVLQASRMKEIVDSRRVNFPPSKNGKYTSDQADEFAQNIVIQSLFKENLPFLAQFQDNAEALRDEVFLSRRVLAYAVFYKYYIDLRDPTKMSDLADLMQVPNYPYCTQVVIEKNFWDKLNQIKKKHNILESTTVSNIDFLKGFSTAN